MDHACTPAFTQGCFTGNPRAFLVHPNDQRTMPVRDQDEPVWTQTANSYGESHQPGPRARAWLEAGRVVSMTPRAIARFQSFPDRYVLPERRGLALRVLGNAVPPLLARAVGLSLRDVCGQEEVME